MTTSPTLAALVAGEDAAIYAYSVAGARVAGAGRRRALVGLDAHRMNRDRAASLIVAAGAVPPGSATAYTLPEAVASRTTARTLMALVENRLVGLYADAAAALAGPDRTWAAQTAVACAMRAVDWGAAPQAFPTGPPLSSPSPTPTAG